MKKNVLAAIAALALVAAPQAWGAGQDPPGDGTPPSGITGGDASQGYVGPLFLEFRDIPDGPLQSELAASRTLRAAARLRGDHADPEANELQVFTADFVCGDPLPPGVVDPCLSVEVCTVNKNGREICEFETLLDFQAEAATYQAIVGALLAPQIRVGYGLDPSAVLSVSKVVEFAKGSVIIGADGVKHVYVAQDIAISVD
jgi:hypothetical protein